VNGDLWIINGSGTAVQITSGATVVATASSNTPPGIMLPYGGSSAPAGYLLCNGAAVSRATYAALFAITGTIYGVGDGATTFNLPSMNGQVPMGAGTYSDAYSGSTTRTLGQMTGQEKVSLVLAEIPAHNHGGGSSHSHFIASPVGAVTANISASNYMATQGNVPPFIDENYMLGGTPTGATVGLTSSVSVNIPSDGSNNAHTNMQPSVGVNYIIKT